MIPPTRNLLNLNAFVAQVLDKYRTVVAILMTVPQAPTLAVPKRVE